jgi:predicted metal-dependent hydrolase
MPKAPNLTVTQRGRAKAYRPLPPEERRAALRAGLAAYERGYYFLAHETLEPAWMGTDDPGERDLHQGLIKLAAAFVHATRGNKLGIEKNLRGARELLAGGVAAGAAEGIDVPRIIAAIETGLSRLEAESALGPIPIFRTTGPTSC